MTQSFDSLGAMAVHLMARYEAMKPALEKGLERCAVKIERTAKGEFGDYQPAVGPFPAWPELADSTKEDRLAKGFSENDPLLRTGGLRGSIEHEVEDFEAVIGSKDPVMAYQEFGTSRMPSRPVLGPAAFHNKEAIQKILGEAVVTGLVGGDAIHALLGYNFKTE